MITDQVRNNYLKLGIIACKSGQLEQAARWLEAGIRESDRLNLKDLGTAALLYNLAVVYHKNGLSNGVEGLLLKCLKLCKQCGGNKHPTLPMVSRLLADHYYDSGNLDAAAQFTRQALKSKSLTPAERVDYLIRLAAIENKSERHANVDKLCNKIFALSSDQYANYANSAMQSASSATASGFHH